MAAIHADCLLMLGRSVADSQCMRAAAIGSTMPVSESTIVFWRAMLRVAFGVFVGEGIAVTVYVVGSPNGPHRTVLTAVALTCIAGATACLLLTPWIARQRWRERFSMAWTLGSSTSLTVCVLLDGGLSSPLLFLILMPVVYAGLLFRPPAAAWCAVVSVGEVLLIAQTDAGHDAQNGQGLMVASVAAGLGVLTWLYSVQHARLDRRGAELTHELEVLATTDHLTGCLNHRAFNDRLTDEVERANRYGLPLSLIVADVDDFKSVNDTYGHPGGDAALELAGATLRERSRRSDAVGRIGGDEFALLLPGIDLAGAAEYARRVFDPEGIGMQYLSFSAGVASLDPREPTAARLFREADRTLYQVKRLGGHGVAIASPGDDSTQLQLQLGRVAE